MKSIMIYRVGSIGDTIVALPCFHGIRKRFPNARVALLTAPFRDPGAVEIVALLAATRLIDCQITYRIGTRSYQELSATRRAIMAFRPEMLIYLAQPRGEGMIGGYLKALRDDLFFRWSGVRRIVGVPHRRDQRECRQPANGSHLWESEAHRLARCVAPVVPVDVSETSNWSLCLTDDELCKAARLLDLPSSRQMGLAIGARHPAKDWGAGNWRVVIDAINDPTLTLVLLGSINDIERSRNVAQGWSGRVVNLCGKISTRESAAVIQHLSLLLCHDGGPMHLAASVGTPCVALFSGIAAPGVWYPFGDGHEILYPTSTPHSIMAIQPQQVIRAVAALQARIA